ncbi:MAG: hypothetical protein ABIV43_03355 [Candidatus Saccharimonadales bacterium]
MRYNNAYDVSVAVKPPIRRQLVEEADFGAPQTRPTEAHEPISWTASEFIAHDKDSNWYVMLGLSTVIVAGIIYLLTRDIIATGFVLFVASLFGVYAGRQPRQLPYQLSNHGLRIGSRHYELRQFRSFSVVPEGAFSSIVLMPLQRFSPMTTIYYAPQDEDRIIDVLAAELPFVEHKHDVIERFMHRIRF